MSEERDDLNFLGALGLLAVGAIIGAAAALLLAPKTGEETRELLRERGTDWARQARDRGSELAKRARNVGDAQVRAQEAPARPRGRRGHVRPAEGRVRGGRGAMREETRSAAATSPGV
jgi:hypothetical protein